MEPGAVRTDAAVAARPPRRRPRLRRLLLGSLLVAALALYLARGLLLPAAARFLNVAEAPRPVDYVMVLGGGADSRPFVAAALVRAGLAGKVLLAASRDAPATEDGWLPSEVETARRVLEVRGVRPESVVLLPGEPCDSTFDEARALAGFLANRPAATVAVVTTNYHTQRARWVFAKVLGERFPQVCFVAPATGGFDESNWWHFEAGFVAYVNEYAKFAYYLVRY